MPTVRPPQPPQRVERWHRAIVAGTWRSEYREAVVQPGRLEPKNGYGRTPSRTHAHARTAAIPRPIVGGFRRRRAGDPYERAGSRRAVGRRSARVDAQRNDRALNAGFVPVSALGGAGRASGPARTSGSSAALGSRAVRWRGVAAPSALGEVGGLAAGQASPNGAHRGGARALAPGTPTQALNLVMDAYGGSRRAHVHGAVAHPVRGHHGLIAECSFAKDVVNPRFLPIANAPPTSGFCSGLCWRRHLEG